MPSIIPPPSAEENDLLDHRHRMRVGQMRRNARHRRQRQHIADADQHAERQQRDAVHAPPPAADERNYPRARERASGSSPRQSGENARRAASKFANWSKLAAAGESSTTPHPCARAQTPPAPPRPACRRRHSPRHARPALAKSRHPGRSETPCRYAGKNGASSSMPPAFATPPAIQTKRV